MYTRQASYEEFNMDKSIYYEIVITHPNVSADSQGFPELKKKTRYNWKLLASTARYISVYMTIFCSLTCYGQFYKRRNTWQHRLQNAERQSCYFKSCLSKINELFKM